MRLYRHQEEALERTAGRESAGYFMDMGLGKTYVGAEKMRRIGNPVNLVVCQKSKIDDWLGHFRENYRGVKTFDLTKEGQLRQFLQLATFHGDLCVVGVINYELTFRRKELERLEDFTLMLDESSLVQNENSKRADYILNKLKASATILLSGTVVNGNYEKLWSQCRLLGWPISKKLFYSQYMEWKTVEADGFKRKVRTGYKNIERLKRKLAQYGGVFVKTEEVFDLPAQTFVDVPVQTSTEYRKFKRDGIVRVEDRTLIGDLQLTKRLYQKLLCGAFSEEKLQAFRDLVDGASDRLVVFYNYDLELEKMLGALPEGRPTSVVNGNGKDLDAYESEEDSVTFVQYQAGAMGLNLQKANKIVYYSLPDGGAELFEQSKKRIHRIGQERPCVYYVLYCRDSIEDREIIPTLKEKGDRIDALFEERSV